ncbi:S-locus-specific glycoprotein S14-like [Fagus crenata]
MSPGSSISMYGRRICANGIWFGRHLLSNIVGLMASVGILASAISRGYLFVIAQKDLNHGIQQIGTHIPTQKGVREEILYNAQIEE